MPPDRPAWPERKGRPAWPERNGRPAWPERKGRPGALLLHGLTGSPESMEGLGAALAGAGFTVRIPLLPGHGTTVDDLEGCGWPDWVASAESAFEALARECSRIVLVGLSMGGSLCCELAARHPGVAGLVVVNPFIDPPAGSFRELLGKMLDQGITRLPGIGGDIAAEGVGEEASSELPVACLLSLSEGLAEVLPTLEQIVCPVLVMTSREDHVVPTVSSDVLADRVSGPVSRVRLENSFHVATMDNDKDEVERLTVEFGAKVTG